MATQQPDVLVVGAGPVGLTAALALVRQGVRVRIIDKCPHAAPESRALGIHARTLEVLERLGAVEPFLAEGIVGQGGRIFLDGYEKVHVSFAHLDTPFPCILFLEQSRTERILGEQLAGLGVAIERRMELVSFTQDAEHVACTLRRADGGEETCHVPYLLGCDGSHSVVRKQLDLQFQGEVFPGSFLLADVHIDSDWPHDEFRVFASRQGMFIAFPIHEDRWRVIAPLEVTSVGELPQEANMALVEKICAERCPPGTRPHDPVWLSLFRVNSRVVDRFRVGRVFVGGDAAHVHSPAGGQGMNTGMQDMFNLAWKLAHTLQGHGSDSLLESYHQERHANATTLVHATEMATQLITSRSTFGNLLRHAGMTLLGHIGFARAKMVNEMSELPIHYRKSPLSAEHYQKLGEWLNAWTEKEPHPALNDCLDFAGGPHAGDRAPDAEGLCRLPSQTRRMFSWWGTDPRYQLLVFTGLAASRSRVAELEQFVSQVNADQAIPVKATLIRCGIGNASDNPVLFDTQSAAHHSYGAHYECQYLVRPDGYVAFRSQPVNAIPLRQYLERTLLPEASLEAV